MNNQANTTLIIANLWLVGAWLIDDMLGWFLMITMSLIWMIMSVVASHQEIRHLKMLQRLQDLKDQAKFLRQLAEHVERENKPRSKPRSRSRKSKR